MFPERGQAMTGRSRRDFDALSEAQIAAGRVLAKRVDPSALVVKNIGELLNAIDAVAEAATGERSFLYPSQAKLTVAPQH